MARTLAVRSLMVRVIAFLRKSPLALDLYSWLTHRFSYLRRQTEIPWEALAVQFGSDYKDVRFFKVNVKKALKTVKMAWCGLSRRKKMLGCSSSGS